MGAAEGMGQMQFLTRMLDVVAFVQVVRIEASLNVAQDWIDSDVTVDVHEVLKGGHDGPSTGQRLTLRFGEGTAMVGQTRVVARRTWARSIELDESYLVFLQRAADGTFGPLEPAITFEVVGEVLGSLVEASMTVPATAALDEIRLSAGLPKPRIGG